MGGELFLAQGSAAYSTPWLRGKPATALGRLKEPRERLIGRVAEDQRPALALQLHK